MGFFVSLPEVGNEVFEEEQWTHRAMAEAALNVVAHQEQGHSSLKATCRYFFVFEDKVLELGGPHSWLHKAVDEVLNVDLGGAWLDVEL